MTLGAKLARLRRESNYTQEQLAGLLGVSRQAISKWESDVSFPETEKLIRISELYGCSLDYLLKEEMEADYPKETKSASSADRIPLLSISSALLQERKSQKELFGMPLYHIGRKARGVFAVGVDAQGVVAVGMKARGIVSFGMLSLGVLSFGLLPVGLLSAGVLALGLIAAGVISAGILSLGAICFGVFTIGAISIGSFSVGALAIGKYAALGDHARAMIALGKTEANGSLFQHLGSLSVQEESTVAELLESIVPPALSWARKLFASFM